MLPPVPRLVYRVVERNPPTEEDYITDDERGIVGPAHRAAGGRSVWDNLDDAIDLARRHQHQANASGQARIFRVAVIDMTEPSMASDEAIYVEQQGRNRHHYQLFGSKHVLAAAARIAWAPDVQAGTL